MILTMKIIFPAPVMKSHTLPKTILNHIRKVVFYKQEIHYQIGFPLFLINLLRIDAENKATKKPNRYIPINTKALYFIPKNVPSEIISPIMILYTGSLAEHVIKGVTNIVSNLSLTFSIFLVEITAGIAQAVPETKGTILFPFSPKGRKSGPSENHSRHISRIFQQIKEI
jgi:hypothetical protein